MNKSVLRKWNTDGDLVVIYQVDDVLLFYTKKNDPEFRELEKISLEQAHETKPYKATKFSWDNVPNDARMSLTWSWQS